MKMVKYYAVHTGVKPGVYLTWKECEAQVKGFSGSTYKSFGSEKDAWDFVGVKPDQKLPTGEISNISINVPQKVTEIISPTLVSAKEPVPIDVSKGWHIFVDGSYNKETKMYGCGIAILKDGKLFKTHSFSGLDEEGLWNVNGEIQAAYYAMLYCRQNRIKDVTIYHDYEGIAKWCTGVWKCNKQGTKFYKQEYDRLSKDVTIKFVHVKAHTGNEWNELADTLCGQACGVK